MISTSAIMICLNAFMLVQGLIMISNRKTDVDLVCGLVTTFCSAAGMLVSLAGWMLL